MFRKRICYSDGKKAPSFGLFIVPIVITIVIGIPLVTKYPIPIAILIVSFVMSFIPILLCALHGAFITNRYVQKHDFHLWKKSKSHSLKDRREAAKEIESMSMRTPCLEKHIKYSNKIAFITLMIWTLIFLVIFSYIIFSALSG